MGSNKERQRGMHFASEERGEPKLHSLSPPMHLLGSGQGGPQGGGRGGPRGGGELRARRHRSAGHPSPRTCRACRPSHAAPPSPPASAAPLPPPRSVGWEAKASRGPSRELAVTPPSPAAELPRVAVEHCPVTRTAREAGAQSGGEEREGRGSTGRRWRGAAVPAGDEGEERRRAEAGFSDVTKNFLAVLADNGRLKFIERIAERFVDLTMAHKGEVKVVVRTVIPLPEKEEKELKETLQDILGKNKTILVEQKIDYSIMGGLVIEFGQKVFDMSIKTRAKQMEAFLRQPLEI